MPRPVPKRSVSGGVVYLALAGLALLAAQSQPDWVGTFQQAVSQLRDGETAAAISSFDGLWKSHPRDAQLAAWIGAELDSTSHHEEAAPWYQRALAIQPDFEPALNNLALNYAIRGEISKAQPLLRSALKMNPSNASAAYNLGLIDLRLGQYREAAGVLAQSRSAPTPPAPVGRIALAEATALFHLRQYALAAEVLQKTSGDADGSRLLLLGSAQALSGNLPASVKTFQEAARRFPDDPQAYYRLALVFLQGWLDHEARDVLEAGLKQIPGSPLLLYGQAVLDDAIGNTDEAVVWVKKSLDEDSKQAAAWALLGKLEASMGQTDDALDVYHRAAGLGAGAEAGVEAAELLIRLQRIPEAERELQGLAKRYPDSARVDRGFGKLYRDEKKFDLAEQYLKQAVNLDPEDPDAPFALGEVFRLTHRMDEARKEFAIFNDKKQVRQMVHPLEMATNSPHGSELK